MAKWLFALLLLVAACAPEPKPPSGKDLFFQVDVDAQVDSLARAFLKENRCGACVYELHINQHKNLMFHICGNGIEVPYKRITIRRKRYDESYLRANGPMMYTEIDGVTFFVYTGAEDRFRVYRDLYADTNWFRGRDTCTCSDWPVVSIYQDSAGVLLPGSPPHQRSEIPFILPEDRQR